MPVIFVTLAPVPGTQQWFNKYLLGRWMLLSWSVKLFLACGRPLCCFPSGQYSLSVATFQYWEFIKHIFWCFSLVNHLILALQEEAQKYCHSIISATWLNTDDFFNTSDKNLTAPLRSVFHDATFFLPPYILTLLPSSVPSRVLNTTLVLAASKLSWDQQHGLYQAHVKRCIGVSGTIQTLAQNCHLKSSNLLFRGLYYYEFLSSAFFHVGHCSFHFLESIVCIFTSLPSFYLKWMVFLLASWTYGI